MTIVFRKCLQAAEPLFRQGLSNPQVAEATGFSLPTLAKARKHLGIAPVRRGGSSPAQIGDHQMSAYIFQTSTNVRHVIIDGSDAEGSFTVSYLDPLPSACRPASHLARNLINHEITRHEKALHRLRRHLAAIDQP
jgi:hypothetical protein